MKLLITAAAVAPKLLGALSLLAGLSFSAAASAATYDLGTLSQGDTVFGYSVPKSDFTDRIDFSLNSFSSLAAGVDSVYLKVRGVLKTDISGLSLAFYSSNGTPLGAPGLDIDAGNQPSGGYYALISGKGIGSSGGQYHGLISVSAVPEAETYAMLLAGLGVIGLISRRRRQNSASVVIA
jgi:hypothetical protein